MKYCNALLHLSRPASSVRCNTSPTVATPSDYPLQHLQPPICCNIFRLSVAFPPTVATPPMQMLNASFPSVPPWSYVFCNICPTQLFRSPACKTSMAAVSSISIVAALADHMFCGCLRWSIAGHRSSLQCMGYMYHR